MSIDDDFNLWSDMLALTESDDNSQAWGDFNSDGYALAAGSWQMHPAFVFEWIKLEDIKVNISWDELFGLALRNFFNKEYPKAQSSGHQDRPWYEILAMWFHLHGNPGGGWDEPYAKRFRDYWNETTNQGGSQTTS